jgi:phosphoribosylformylglycinamidine synthase
VLGASDFVLHRNKKEARMCGCGPKAGLGRPKEQAKPKLRVVEPKTVQILVTPRPNIPDSQGIALKSQLDGLGFNEVTEVEISKLFILTVTTADPARIKMMCEQLLAHQEVENYQFKILD